MFYAEQIPLCSKCQYNARSSLMEKLEREEGLTAMQVVPNPE